MLDGIVFPGGLDVHPLHYGEAHVHPATEVDPTLDTLELQLARWAVSSDIPTLGICRGQQLLNVALGGTLIQDLPSERLPTGVAHRQAGQRWELSHTIEVEVGSRLAGILGSTMVEVNSFHHQAVRRLGERLRAVAWSPDGIIEGVEGTDHPWLLAVQFHPEDLVRFHDPSRRLFRALVRACEQGMPEQRATGIRGGRRAIL
jgi:putative glutamine amidotransferase